VAYRSEGKIRMDTKFKSKKLKVKRPLGRCRCRLEDNIKIDLKGIRCGYGLD
jgi:hypothetical protein